MIYNAADIFMGNSMSEGFGIPIIEAQACGAPVVVTDFSAMPELVRWGYKIEPADMFWSPMNAWQAWPDVRGIKDALDALHTDWHANGDAWPLSQRLRASGMIHDEFSWDTIVRDQWAPFVTKMGMAAPPLDARFLQHTQPTVQEPITAPEPAKKTPYKRQSKMSAVTPGVL
jgi:glycosyltransferase involved in cell wall biosynthesis